MTNQRQDLYNHDPIQHEYLDKLSMRHPQDEDPYLQEQNRQRQENPKLEKNGQITKRIKFSRENVQSKNKITKNTT